MEPILDARQIAKLCLIAKAQSRRSAKRYLRNHGRPGTGPELDRWLALATDADRAAADAAPCQTKAERLAAEMQQMKVERNQLIDRLMVLAREPVGTIAKWTVADWVADAWNELHCEGGHTMGCQGGRFNNGYADPLEEFGEQAPSPGAIVRLMAKRPDEPLAVAFANAMNEWMERRFARFVANKKKFLEHDCVSVSFCASYDAAELDAIRKAW